MNKNRLYAYLKIYEDILKDIDSQMFSSNRKLPSENELAKKYNVNRHTVRKALLKLKEDGKIVTKIGKGNFLKEININKNNLLNENIFELESNTKNKLISTKILEVPKQIFENFQTIKNLDVIELKILKYVKHDPICLSVMYFDAYFYRNILNNLNIKPFSIHKLLQVSYPNIKTKKTRSKFSAFLPDKKLQEILKIPPKTPILSASITIKDQFNITVAYAINNFRSDIYNIEVDLA